MKGKNLSLNMEIAAVKRKAANQLAEATVMNDQRNTLLEENGKLMALIEADRKKAEAKAQRLLNRSVQTLTSLTDTKVAQKLLKCLLISE
jgi:hypothetical protein